MKYVHHVQCSAKLYADPRVQSTIFAYEAGSVAPGARADAIPAPVVDSGGAVAGPAEPAPAEGGPSRWAVEALSWVARSPGSSSGCGRICGCSTSACRRSRVQRVDVGTGIDLDGDRSAEGPADVRPRRRCGSNGRWTCSPEPRTSSGTSGRGSRSGPGTADRVVVDRVLLHVGRRGTRAGGEASPAPWLCYDLVDACCMPRRLRSIVEPLELFCHTWVRLNDLERLPGGCAGPTWPSCSGSPLSRVRRCHSPLELKLAGLPNGAHGRHQSAGAGPDRGAIYATPAYSTASSNSRTTGAGARAPRHERHLWDLL